MPKRKHQTHALLCFITWFDFFSGLAVACTQKTNAIRPKIPRTIYAGQCAKQIKIRLPDTAVSSLSPHQKPWMSSRPISIWIKYFISNHPNGLAHSTKQNVSKIKKCFILRSIRKFPESQWKRSETQKIPNSFLLYSRSQMWDKKKLAQHPKHSHRSRRFEFLVFRFLFWIFFFLIILYVRSRNGFDLILKSHRSALVDGTTQNEAKNNQNCVSQPTEIEARPRALCVCKNVCLWLAGWLLRPASEFRAAFCERRWEEVNGFVNSIHINVICARITL